MAKPPRHYPPPTRFATGHAPPSVHRPNAAPAVQAKPAAPHQGTKGFHAPPPVAWPAGGKVARPGAGVAQPHPAGMDNRHRPPGSPVIQPATIGDVMGNAETAHRILSFIPGREQIPLTRVNQTFRAAVHAVGDYDGPLNRRPDMKIERNGGVTGNAVQTEFDLEALADIAWHCFHKLLDEVYSSLQPLDSVQAERGRNYATNAKSGDSKKRAWAVVPVNGRPRYSTNYLAGREVIRADGTLSSNTGMTMYHPGGHYGRIPSFHAELRVAHSRTTADTPPRVKNANPIAVNMAYCIFCAVHLAALGERLIHPFHTGNLDWYRFSEWILLFRSQRRRVWGPVVERAYEQMNRETRKAFLQRLIKRTSGGSGGIPVTWGQSPSLPPERYETIATTAYAHGPAEGYWAGSYEQFSALNGRCPNCGCRHIVIYETGWHEFDASCGVCELRFFVEDMPHFHEMDEGSDMELE